jgi:hypothetical protein
MSYATLAGFTVACNSAGTAVYYTPPIAREALKATLSLETTHFHVAVSGVVVVTVQHKDLADTSWATAGTFADITEVGVDTLTLSGLKEELRLKVAFSGGVAGNIAHILLAAVTWLFD